MTESDWSASAQNKLKPNPTKHVGKTSTSCIFACVCVFPCWENMWITQPKGEVIRSPKSHWSKHTQVGAHKQLLLQHTPGGEKRARQRPPMLPPPLNWVCVRNKLPAELPIESVCILCKTRCMSLSGWPARRWRYRSAGYSCMCHHTHDPSTSSTKLNSNGGRGTNFKILSWVSGCRRSILLPSFFLNSGL